MGNLTKWRRSLNKMKRSLKIWLFACGFMIGIFLEIFLIERGKFNLHSKQEALEKSVHITCLVLLKHKHTRYVNSSRKTWLEHCSDYHILNVRRLRDPKKPIDLFPNVRKCQNSTENNKTCSKEEDVREISARSSWGGLCKALRVADTNRSEWFMIVPDSLVVLVENLKLLVKELDCDESHYYGYALKNYEADYNVLSAGILLSRGTLRRLFEGFRSEEDCDLTGKYWRNEDLYLGKYLKKLNIFPKDTRDEEGRGRFHGFNMNNILWPGKLFIQSDYHKKALYPVSQGFNCCSPFLITIDVSDPDAMYNLYFFLYKLTTSHREIPKPVKLNKSEDSSWKDFLRADGYSAADIENMTSEEYYRIWEKKLPPDTVYKDLENFLKNHREQLN